MGRMTLVCAFAIAALVRPSMPAAEPAAGTRVVMLGTGTPRPDPEHSGPATAIVVNGASYLVDLGPGVVRRAEAARRKGFVTPSDIRI